MIHPFRHWTRQPEIGVRIRVTHPHERCYLLDSRHENLCSTLSGYHQITNQLLTMPERRRRKARLKACPSPYVQNVACVGPQVSPTAYTLGS